MTELWLGIAALTIIAIGFIFFPLYRFSKTRVKADPVSDRTAQNVAIFKERVAELQAEFDSGSLDSDAFQELKLELEKNLLIDAAESEQPLAKQTAKVGGTALITVTLLALILPVGAMGLYGHLGASADFEVAEQRKARLGKEPQSVEEAVAMLEQELKVQPENIEGWYMLATTRMNLGQFDLAAAAFRELLTRVSEDVPGFAGLVGQYAQALFFEASGKFTDEVKTQVDRALALDPNDMTSLGLLGINAFEMGEYQQAIDYWEKALMTARGDAVASLQSGINKARAQLGMEPLEVREAELVVDISIDAALREQLSGDETVFVFARSSEVPMPLAAARLTVSELPTMVTLNDAMAMNPQFKLSTFESVEVTARISKSGQPKAQAGDLFGALNEVSTSTETKLTLQIDQVVE